MNTIKLARFPEFLNTSDFRKVPAKRIEKPESGVQKWRFTVKEDGHVYLVDVLLDLRGGEPCKHSVELHIPAGQPLPLWAEDCLEPELATRAV